jgi:nicotinamidase-related amidase
MARGFDNTALLVMDIQPSIVERIDNADDYLSRVRLAVDYAHQTHTTLIYVVVGFRSDFPEVSLRNKSFSSIKDRAMTGMTNPRPVIPATDDDIVITKRRISAFTGSDLEVVLRAKAITHLVLSGISTSGVVLSTVREAADKDFELTVLSDLCVDFDPEVNTVLLEKVFPKQANVITAQQWINGTGEETNA